MYKGLGRWKMKLQHGSTIYTDLEVTKNDNIQVCGSVSDNQIVLLDEGWFLGKRWFISEGSLYPEWGVSTLIV